MLSTEFTNAKCLCKVSVAVSTRTNFVMETICVKQSDRPSLEAVLISADLISVFPESRPRTDDE